MWSQNVGINTVSPNVDAILDIDDSGKGFLPTRLQLIATNDEHPLSAHTEGIITYNLTESGNYSSSSVHEGLYYNDGVQWNLMGPNATSLGDIKHSLESNDHSGWYLLDGRNKSSLPNLAQNNATAIGIGLSLPNCSDSFLKTTNGTESIQTMGGTNSITLTQGNLPNITYVTTTSTNGNHSHAYTDFHNGPKSLGLATNVIALVPLISETVGTNDILPGNLYSTNNEGIHNHSVTVPSGGLGIPINAAPMHMVTNLFIYLGE
ncbi:hypothetical protein [Flavobacterium sp.]|uniref:hypothetical protein n=1 Tax=Flavobacterium sp. TaxID=239 RepID=UPI0028BDA1B8|nr:hypothetical protein [Flavobacterium sp.]